MNPCTCGHAWRPSHLDPVRLLACVECPCTEYVAYFVPSPVEPAPEREPSAAERRRAYRLALFDEEAESYGRRRPEVER